MVSGELTILCFLIWVLCSLHKNPLPCTLVICTLFLYVNYTLIKSLLKIKLDGIIHRSFNQPHINWKYIARSDK